MAILIDGTGPTAERTMTWPDVDAFVLTKAAAPAAHAVVVGTGAALVATVAPDSSTGKPLVSQGASADPAYADLTVAHGGTGATTLTGLVKGNGTSAMTAVTAPSGAVVGDTDTQTLTAKRITARVTTITSSGTPTINTDTCDAVTITAQAAAITSMTTNLSGTPTNFQKLIIRIKDDGTARAITWGASFVAKGTALPTTTVISKLLTVGFIYDTVAATWGCVASAQEA